MDIPVIEQVPKFDLELFHTVLLPYNDFKPLDSGTLSTFRMMINETSPRIIANHMTRVDIKLVLGEWLCDLSRRKVNIENILILFEIEKFAQEKSMNRRCQELVHSSCADLSCADLSC